MSSSATRPTLAHPRRPTPISVGRRVLILIMVVLGSTLYATTLLIASTLLPQMQGTMSATQDEIAWAMTFNILATAVMTPMTGWLAARFGRRETMIWSVFCFTVDDPDVRPAEFARDAGPVAHPAGRARRAGDPAVADHPARRLPQAAAGLRDLDLRHGRRHRPGDRPDRRRHAVGDLQLALGLLHDRAGRLPVLHRPAADPARRQADRPHQPRLDRLPVALDRDRRRPARAVARPAARLVRIRARS